MKLATLLLEQSEVACVLLPAGFVPVRAIAEQVAQTWPADLLGLLTTQTLDEVHRWHDDTRNNLPVALARAAIPFESAKFAPLYRRPRKIWGIGLNYRAHAAELNESAPTAEPASFLKPDTSIIGPGDTIRLPRLAQKTTGEA
ncbi:MAG: fumarylacetoacetate hydrolase family protein, partial [Candidatus Didemnitutus sp.]|nr:fumarylacetoacetate hydrolase family protein [Candidatus Didemnitutus sp.]